MRISTRSPRGSYLVQEQGAEVRPDGEAGLAPQPSKEPPTSASHPTLQMRWVGG